MKTETLGTRKIMESDDSPEMAQCVKMLASNLMAGVQSPEPTKGKERAEFCSCHLTYARMLW